MLRVFLITFIFCSSTQMSSAQEIDNLRFMFGAWQQVKGDTITYESWEKVDFDNMSGFSTTIIKGDTMFYEKLNIRARGGDVNYFAKLPNKLAKFSLDFIGLNEASFADPKNDFPALITYKSPAPDVLEITLSGTFAGNPVSEMIRMVPR
jgi:hypothetical protein